MFNMIQIFNRMANISNAEKIMIGIPAEDDDEEEEDVGEKEAIILKLTFRRKQNENLSKF